MDEGGRRATLHVDSIDPINPDFFRGSGRQNSNRHSTTKVHKGEARHPLAGVAKNRRRPMIDDPILFASKFNNRLDSELDNKTL